MNWSNEGGWDSREAFWYVKVSPSTFSWHINHNQIWTVSIKQGHHTILGFTETRVILFWSTKESKIHLPLLYGCNCTRWMFVSSSWTFTDASLIVVVIGGKRMRCELGWHPKCWQKKGFHLPLAASPNLACQRSASHHLYLGCRHTCWVFWSRNWKMWHEQTYWGRKLSWRCCGQRQILI